MKYSEPKVKQFIEDMEEAGIETVHYHGRHFWEGPAVRTNNDFPTEQDVYGATKVRLQKDSLGLYSILYPVVRDPGIEE